MKKLVCYALLLVLIVWAGIAITDHPGYVTFYVGDWKLITRLWTFIVALLLLLVLIQFIWRIFYIIFSPNGRVRRWYLHRQVDQSHSKTAKGLIALTEADWKKAEKLLLASIDSSRMPLINYLAAASAAHHQGKVKEVEKYLRRAYKLAPKQKLAIGLTQAKLQIKQKQFEQALATLNHLRHLAPKHQYVLFLLQQTYFYFKDWDNLIKLLPLLKKHKIIEYQALAKLELDCYCQKLNQFSAKQLQQGWKKVPMKLRQQALAVDVYVSRLIEQQQHDLAVETSFEFLKKQWDERLLLLFGKAKYHCSEKQFKFAEQLLKQHGRSALSLFISGKLAARRQLWGLASELLAESISKRPTAEAYCQLGLVQQQIGESKKACANYQSSAALLLE